MKVLDQRVKNEEVQLVNNLIEQSFGDGWRGDYDCSTAYAEVGNVLGVIAKKLGPLPIGHPGDSTFGKVISLISSSLHKKVQQYERDISKGRPIGSRVIAGYVGDGKKRSDGSVIAVLSSAENEAREYARLYEAQTRKETTIVLVDEINLDRNPGFIFID